jgi:hypothetical protein
MPLQGCIQTSTSRNLLQSRLRSAFIVNELTLRVQRKE